VKKAQMSFGDSMKLMADMRNKLLGKTWRTYESPLVVLNTEIKFWGKYDSLAGRCEFLADEL
jgi:hypothetical protein